MTLEKIFKFDRINNEQYYAEEITFLSILKLNLFINKKKGRHLSLRFGIGPFETELTLRFWNGAM